MEVRQNTFLTIPDLLSPQESLPATNLDLLYIIQPLYGYTLLYFKLKSALLEQSGYLGNYWFRYTPASSLTLQWQNKLLYLQVSASSIASTALCLIMEYCSKFMEYCNLLWSTVVNLCGTVFPHSPKAPFYKGLRHPSPP